jgi:hypothetical protein
MSAPVDHPPPWRWGEPHGQETSLWDANDGLVMADGNDSTIVVASPYVRELVRSAPEMEALLRKIERYLDPDAGWCPGCTPYLSGEHDEKCQVMVLLKRLDEARRG